MFVPWSRWPSCRHWSVNATQLHSDVSVCWPSHRSECSTPWTHQQPQQCCEVSEYILYRTSAHYRLLRVRFTNVDQISVQLNQVAQMHQMHFIQIVNKYGQRWQGSRCMGHCIMRVEPTIKVWSDVHGSSRLNKVQLVIWSELRWCNKNYG